MNMDRVETLLPHELGRARVPIARGATAGGWVFATGALATDDCNAFATEMEGGGRPLSGEPRWSREARRMYQRAAEVLAAGGTDFPHAVRTDQYFPDWRAVSFLHQV